ncbi:zinc ribbon domain-containing protein [Methanobacterium formicicum]|uniref:Zinc-ribbon domain-containing protein n=1 Tax=Methanobacterium formicicum TaxID=2162 RepID=A0A0S4FLV7_METFO|nr:zinc ribbon domain-containing protein [Methanobacterium formicicum]CEL24006.1 hypothetical protein MB9_0358 [Methanobacterium formicicum]
MGYLICAKCGGYYELQDGESPADFESCECGGTLKYTENGDNINSQIKETPIHLTCPLCGTENPEIAEFCASCGNNLSKENEKTILRDEKVSNLQKKYNKSPNRGYKNKFSIALILILLISVSMAIYLVNISNTSINTCSTEENAPEVKLSNFTAKGVTFEYPSDSWTCVEGSGNTIAELTYKNGGATAYVEKYPGTSLEELKSLISMEPHTTNNKITKTYVGYNAEYSGYTIDGQPKASFNVTEYTTIFEVGDTSYRISVESKSKSTMSHIVIYIANSIQIT